MSDVYFEYTTHYVIRRTNYNIFLIYMKYLLTTHLWVFHQKYKEVIKEAHIYVHYNIINYNLFLFWNNYILYGLLTLIYTIISKIFYIMLLP